MPDEISLPTADELRKLPRWAVVAFTARCARPRTVHATYARLNLPCVSRGVDSAKSSYSGETQ